MPMASKQAITASAPAHAGVPEHGHGFRLHPVEDEHEDEGQGADDPGLQFSWAVREPILASICSRLRTVEAVRSMVSARPPPVSLAMRMAEVMSTVLWVGTRRLR